jgi:hypothetical protein
MNCLDRPRHAAGLFLFFISGEPRPAAPHFFDRSLLWQRIVIAVTGRGLKIAPI